MQLNLQRCLLVLNMTKISDGWGILYFYCTKHSVCVFFSTLDCDVSEGRNPNMVMSWIQIWLWVYKCYIYYRWKTTQTIIICEIFYWVIETVFRLLWRICQHWYYSVYHLQSSLDLIQPYNMFRALSSLCFSTLTLWQPPCHNIKASDR